MAEDRPGNQDPIFSQLVEEDESFADLVEEFVQSLGERITKIEQAATASDWTTLRMLAHQLRGSAGGYGYPVITETAGQLEQCALAGELEAAQREVEGLKGLISRVVVRIDE
jgi:HPt (histidine-containing phosphotransfer) domain-containing protein